MMARAFFFLGGGGGGGVPSLLIEPKMVKRGKGPLEVDEPNSPT